MIAEPPADPGSSSRSVLRACTRARVPAPAALPSCQQHLYGLASWPVYNPRSEIGHFKPENLHVRLHVLGLLVTSTAGHAGKRNAVAVVTDDNRKLQVDTMKSGILFFIAAAF